MLYAGQAGTGKQCIDIIRHFANEHLTETAGIEIYKSFFTNIPARVIIDATGFMVSVSCEICKQEKRRFEGNRSALVTEMQACCQREEKHKPGVL